MKPAKILYFVKGPAPSPEDFADATSMSATVVFRNATVVPNEPHSLEICDGVAGCVPPIYAAQFPPAADAIKTKKAELAELTSRVGDSAPPKASGKAASAADKTDAPAPAGAGKPGAAAGAWTANGGNDADPK